MRTTAATTTTGTNAPAGSAAIERTVRRPDIRWDVVPQHWCPRLPELSQYCNVVSVHVPIFERFLNRTMLRASRELAPEHRALKQEIAWFTQQEGEHLREHQAFNAALERGGFRHLSQVDAAFTNHYVAIEKSKSLRWKLAYCVAFESAFAVVADVFFPGGFFDPYLEGVPSEVLSVWRWHMLEEFEHRSVAFDLFCALYGTGLSAYQTRLKVQSVAVRDFAFGGVEKSFQMVVAADRAQMSKEELRASRRRWRAFKRREFAKMLPTLLTILSPTFHPKNLSSPLLPMESLNTYPTHSKVSVDLRRT